MVGRDGGVPPHDHLAVDLGRQEDVLPRRQAEDVVGGGQREIELERIPRQHRLLLQGVRALVLGVERHPPPGFLANAILGDVALVDARRVQVADVELVEHLGRLRGVDGDEVVRGVLPGVDQDGVCAARVQVEVLGAVVDLPLDDYPHVLLPVVPAHLRHGYELGLADVLRGRRGRGGRGGLGLLGGRRLPLLQEPAEARRVGLVGEPRHPPPLELTWLGGVLEPKAVPPPAVDPVEPDLDPEDLVVPHPHEVPRRVGRLGVVGVVPRAAPHLLAPHEVGYGQIERPPHPAPIHAVIGRLLDEVDLAHLPVLPPVRRQLHARDPPPAPRVGVPPHLVGPPDALLQVDDLVVVRRRHRRVDVQLVEYVLRLVPPPPREALLGRDVRGEDAIVVVVIVVLRLVLDDVDVREPLDHAAADVPRYDEPHREAVVRLQPLAVGLVRDQDVVRGVHRAGERDRRAVLDELPPRLVLEGSGTDLVRQVLPPDELHVLAPHVPVPHARGEEEIAQRHALPHVRGHAPGAPVEPDRLPDHVLLLPPVAGAHERHRQLPRRHGRDVVHAEIELVRDEVPPDAQAVLLPLDVGTRTVIPDVVEAAGGDELELLMDREGRLDVEGVPSGQPHELPVAGDPLVRRAHVAVVGVRAQVPHGRGLRDDVRARGASVLVRHGHGDGGGVRTVQLLARGGFSPHRVVVDLLEVRYGRGRLDQCGQVDGGLGNRPLGTLHLGQDHGIRC